MFLTLRIRIPILAGPFGYFAPPIFALTVFGRGGGLAVLTWRDTKLRTDFRRSHYSLHRVD
jgi:hypothetical protein